MKATWFLARGGGFRGNTTGAKMFSGDGKEIDTLLVSSVGNTIKPDKNSKAKAKDYSHLEDKSENFNFKKMKIRVDFDSD